LRHLSVTAKIPDVGFLGVGRSTGRAQPSSMFTLSTPQGDAPELEILDGANYHRQFVNDPDRCGRFPVRWLQTAPKEASPFVKRGRHSRRGMSCRLLLMSTGTLVSRCRQSRVQVRRPNGTSCDHHDRAYLTGRECKQFSNLHLSREQIELQALCCRASRAKHLSTVEASSRRR
jgi:hypothetical protein